MLAGAAGGVFFWLSDPRWGVARLWVGSRGLIDAANEARPGTWVGMAASGLVLLVGLWLTSRRGG